MTKTIESKERVFTGKAFSVDLVDVNLPDGTRRQYDLVVHSPAVTLVPVDERGNLLMVRQYRLGADQTLLEFPAGVLSEGEDPQTGAARELREETGMAAANLIPLGDFYMTPGYCTEQMFVFLATGLFPAPLPADDDEFLHLVKIPIDRIEEYVANGELVDGKTLASLFFAREHLFRLKNQPS